MQKNRFYIKMLTIIIIIATFPVIIVGFFSYLKSSDTIQANISKEKEQSVYQIQENIEQTLKMVDVSMTNFVTSYQLVSTLNEPLKPSQFQIYNHTKKELTQIQQFDSGINNLLLVSLDQGWRINNSGLKKISQDDIDHITDQYFSLPSKSYWTLEHSNDVLFDSVGSSCNYYFSLVKQLPLISTDKSGLSIAYIPTCHFKEILQQNANSESIMILDENYKIVGHSDYDSIGGNLSDKHLLDTLKAQDENNGQYEIHRNESDYKVTFRKSLYNSWTYVSMVKLSELNKQSYSIGWFTLIICIIVLIGILLCAFLASHRLYAPINKIVSTISDSFSNILDNGKGKRIDEFSMIEQQIYHMLDQNDQLESKLQSQVTQLKQFFMARLLKDKVTEDELISKLASYNYNHDWKQFSVFLIQIDSLDDSRYDANHEDLLLFTINTMIEEIIPPENRLTPIIIDQTQATIYFNNEEQHSSYTKSITTVINNIQEKVKEELSLSISIGISKPYYELIDTNKAYKESLEALRYTLKYGAGSVIFFENLQRESSFYTSYPRQIENKLFDAIKLENKEEVDINLDKLIGLLFDEQQTHTQYELSIVRFLTNLIELTETLGVDVLEFEEHKSLFDQLYEFKTLPEVVKWFKYTIIYPVMNKVKERSQSQYKNISDEIIHIVQQEFESDLTLNYIADKLHYNPNYLSSIFRKETNTSFSEYLTHFRINKAKEWLTTTDMTVKEIAERLNYNNSQNFIRSFRKLEGTTPGKYRQEQSKPPV